MNGAAGANSSGASAGDARSTPFFGRRAELGQFIAELRDPRGAAILVVGQQGMGKTLLLDRFLSIAGEVDGLQCGAVREEVTPSDSVDSTLSIFMDRAYEAAQLDDGSFDATPRRLKQWRAFLNIINIGDLVLSLRRDPRRNTREQFLAAIEAIAAKLPENGRAVFVVDPEKYLPPHSDQDWAIVIRHLPAKVKFVFAQRPEDALADSDLIAGLANVRRIPNVSLYVLDEQGLEDMIAARASETGLSGEELRQTLAPYARHPYAVTAAVNLLAADVAREQLPNEPDPVKFAAEQWKQIQRGGQNGVNGEQAIRLFQAYAILEVTVPDDLVEEVSGLTGAQRMSLTVDAYLGPLLRQEGEHRRIYHVILVDYIRSQASDTDVLAMQRTIIDRYRSRLQTQPPSGLAAQRLAFHCSAVHGEDAFVSCFVQECTVPLMRLGLLDDAIAMTELGLRKAAPESDAEAVLCGNLGLVTRTRGDLNEAEALHRKALRIYQRLRRIDGMAIQYGNLGIVMRIRGDLEGAEAMYRKALDIDEKLGRLEGMASQYGNLGLVMQTRGDIEGAEGMYRKALAIHEKLGRLEGMANNYGNLGIIMQGRGELTQAEAMYRKALDIDVKLGRLEGIASSYGNLAIVMLTQGELDDAESMLRKALVIHKNLGQLEGMASSYGNLGIILQTRGDFMEAEIMYRKALAVDEQLGRMKGVANAYSNLGTVLGHRRKLDEAEAMFRQALAIDERLGRLDGMAREYGNIGLVMQTRGEHDDAEAMYRKSLAIHQKLHQVEGKAHDYGNLGIVMKSRGHTEQARAMWIQARDLFAKLGAKHMVEKMQGWLDDLSE